MECVLVTAKLDIIKRNSDPFIQQILFAYLLFTHWMPLDTLINLSKKVPALKELTF